MHEDRSVSIVIATYNRKNTLRTTIESLRYQRFADFELIVVCGPCTDGTQQMLEDLGETLPLTVVHIEERNLSRARNFGILSARGAIVAFLDDDAVPEPDWLERIVAAFAEPRIGAVGGFIRNHTGSAFQAKAVVCNEFGQGVTYESAEVALASCAESPNAYLSLTGANVAFRRGALLAIGGFDENFEYFLDETDVNIRMSKEFTAVICEDAEVHHKYAESHLRTSRNVPKSMLPIARSVAYFAMKHALPVHGWQRTIKFLRDFEMSEIKYKTANYAYGDIDNETLGRLCSEIKRGIREGVKRGLSLDNLSWEERVFSYPDTVRNSPARQFQQFKAIRPAQERLRLCMFSQQEGAVRGGGIARWTVEAAEGLAKRGHEVTVVGFREGDVSTVDFTRQNYWSHRIASDRHSDIPAEANLLDLPQPQRTNAHAASQEFQRVYDRRRFNVVSTPIWDVEGAALLGRPSRERRAPVVLSLHTTWRLAAKSKPEWSKSKDFFENHVQKIFRAERVALQKADLILANSRAIVSDIENEYQYALAPDRVMYVPHGLADLPRQPVLDKLARRAGGTVRVLFVGRLEKRKGPTILCDAVSVLLAEGHDIVVDFVGEGFDNEETRSVQKLQFAFPGRVFHRGFVTEPELQRYYMDADVLVAPSEYESFGLIAIEAMRAGVPCIVSRVGGLQEIVAHGTDGFVVDHLDVAGFCSAIKELCLNAERRQSMAHAARQTFEREYHVDTMCERLEQVYFEAARRFRSYSAAAA